MTGPIPRVQRAGRLLPQLAERRDHRPNDSSARPAASTSRGPGRGRVRVAASRATSDRARRAARACRCSAAGAGRPRVARMPALLPAAKPALRSSAMTLHAGHALGPRRALPSVDALSTTMMSCVVAGGASCSDGRQRSRSARALKLTMTIDSVIAGRRDPFEARQRRGRPRRPTNSAPAPPGARREHRRRARRIVEQRAERRWPCRRCRRART